jgi:hypothetical protein
MPSRRDTATFPVWFALVGDCVPVRRHHLLSSSNRRPEAKAITSILLNKDNTHQRSSCRTPGTRFSKRTHHHSLRSSHNTVVPVSMPPFDGFTTTRDGKSVNSVKWPSLSVNSKRDVVILDACYTGL